LGTLSKSAVEFTHMLDRVFVETLATELEQDRDRTIVQANRKRVCFRRRVAPERYEGSLMQP